MLTTTWDVEGTDEFDEWYGGLTEPERRAVIAVVDLLERFGPRPFVYDQYLIELATEGLL